MASPKELAAEYVSCMSSAEKELIRQYAAGDYEARLESDPATQGWSTGDIAACLDEIDRLCGYIPDLDD